MKKGLSVLLTLCFALGLTACNSIESKSDPTTEAVTTNAPTTEIPTTVAASTEPATEKPKADSPIEMKKAIITGMDL